MSEKGIRIGVIVVDLFEAASAIIGAAGLVLGFMDIPITALTRTPFADFTVPALLLGVVVGGSALVAALIAALGYRRVDALAAAIAGCMTVGYLMVEIAMLGLVAWPQVVWLMVGLVMIGLAVLLWQAESSSSNVARTATNQRRAASRA